MDFTLNGVRYYVHRTYTDTYKLANYVYYKDGDLVFVDYIGTDLKQTIALFKILKRK